MSVNSLRFLTIAATLSTVLLAVGRPALAEPWDIDSLGEGIPSDATGNAPADVRFRRMTMELAFALTPRSEAPGETLGVSGFEVGLDESIVSINTSQPYWQGVTQPIVESARLDGQPLSGPMNVVGLHIRKGLPFSFEIGTHLNYILNSSMFMLGVELRWALLEGFRNAPDITFRGAGSRLMGAADIDMTTAEADITVGKTFPVAGMFQLQPYVGGGMVFANIFSTIIDSQPTTPGTKSAIASGGSLFTYAGQNIGDSSNFAGRAFAGLRFHSNIVFLLYELDIGFVANSLAVVQNSFKAGFEF